MYMLNLSYSFLRGSYVLCIILKLFYPSELKDIMLNLFNFLMACNEFHKKVVDKFYLIPWTDRSSQTKPLEYLTKISMRKHNFASKLRQTCCFKP